MAVYDFIFLLNEEEELKKIKTLATSLSAKVLEESSLGKKTLAYPIKKQPSAHFYEWTIELLPPQVSEFKKKLNFEEKILRHLLLKKD